MATFDTRVGPIRARLAREAPTLDIHQLNLLWLSRLRWAWALAQLGSVLSVHFVLGIQLPLTALGVAIGLELVSNVLLVSWLRRRPLVGEPAIASLIAFDLLVFTGLLYLTGGPSNPFSSLYLIFLALAALVVRPRFTWPLVLLTLLCSGALFVWHRPLALGDHDHSAMGHYGAHLKGMWVALGFAASFIVYYSSRLSRAISTRDAALEKARERAARSQQVAALATLAAGAAHELASPLSTIAVVAKELERSLSDRASTDQLEDVRLIRSEVARCNDILADLTADSGHARGETVGVTTPRELVALALDGLAGSERVKLGFSQGSEDAEVRLPKRLVARAIRGILENALDASVPAGSVEVSSRTDARGWRIDVRDRGPGMPPEVSARATEPFFTTKATGQGMGLGLFLTASIADQLGGQLGLDSEVGRGTTASLELPV